MRWSVRRLIKRMLLLLLLLGGMCLLATRRLGQLSSRTPQAPELHNIAYIKVFKTGSETLASLLRRFGLRRGLSFAMPLPGKIYFGWPAPLSRRNVVLPPGVARANLFAHHSVYNRTFLDALMARPCVFLASVREPFRQVQSLFDYYNLAGVTGLGKRQDAFAVYMRNLTAMEAVYKSPSSAGIRYCVPNNYSMTRNSMATVLGFVDGDDPRKFAERIVSEFDLIMVADYFAESLILLKHTMRWRSFKDLLYQTLNSKARQRAPPESSPDLVRIHRRWSPADYELYALANRTLWQRVAAAGASFGDEVAAFRRTLAAVQRHCRRVRDGVGVGNFSSAASRWSTAFGISREDCRNNEDDGVKRIDQISRSSFTGSAADVAKLSFC